MKESADMALNPNVPYEVFQGGQYVGLPSHSAAHSAEVPFIRAAQYKGFEERYNKLSYDTREILGKLAWAAAAPKFPRDGGDSTLSGMSPTRRDMVIADLKKHGLGRYNEQDKTFGLDGDDKTIVRDIRGGKKGFNTPVYNVGGSPVSAEHFDDAGNLARHVAKSHGVPSERSAAIAAGTEGIRSALLQTPPKRPFRLTAPALPR
jgi:hypothetical protein